MRIGIDCRALSRAPCGIYRYIKGLLRAIAREKSADDFFLFSDTGLPADSIPSAHFHPIVVPSKSTLFWEQYVLPRLVRNYRVGLFHCPQNYGVGYFTPARVIVTVHDIIPRLFREFWHSRPLIRRVMYNLGLKISLEKARHVVADSENTRQDIIRVCGIRQERVSVIYPALDESFTDYGRKNLPALARGALPASYLLHLAGDGFHKNTALVIRAYAALKKQRAGIAPLVIAGAGPSDGYAAACDCDGIIFTGPVSEEEMKAIYSHAAIFIYPSLYEGFGLPVLEAMSFGVSVIASKTSSLPEVGADAVVYVDPRSESDLIEKITRILDNPQEGSELAKKGFQRIAHFSWETAARRMLELYQKVYHENP